MLLRGDLDFHHQRSDYASHNLHAFAAKFPPQLPARFIQGLTQPNEVVLDPMVGSGTTIVEAFLLGRRGIGFDIDELAIRLCRVKIRPLPAEQLWSAGRRVLTHAHKLLATAVLANAELAQRFDARTKKFVDYWFLPSTQRELMSLLMAIEQERDTGIRDFLELAFSSIVITKSGGVSRARDLAHSRPHLDKSKVPRNAHKQFQARLRKNINSLAQLQRGTGSVRVELGDARSLPLPDQSVDLIVTSPPYANAIDYVRAHKFSLVWFGKPIEELTEARATYIGSERVKGVTTLPLSPKAERVVEKLSLRDARKAAILRKYFSDMILVIREMRRVLRSGRAAIVVVGSSTMRGMNVETHYCLADIAASIGFDVVDIAERQLDRNRRMMPARFGKKPGSMIEQRMHNEFVIGLLKP